MNETMGARPGSHGPRKTTPRCCSLATGPVIANERSNSGQPRRRPTATSVCEQVATRPGHRLGQSPRLGGVLTRRHIPRLARPRARENRSQAGGVRFRYSRRAWRSLASWATSSSRPRRPPTSALRGSTQATESSHACCSSRRSLFASSRVTGGWGGLPLGTCGGRRARGRCQAFGAAVRRRRGYAGGVRHRARPVRSDHRRPTAARDRSAGRRADVCSRLAERQASEPDGGVSRPDAS